MREPHMQEYADWGVDWWVTLSNFHVERTHNALLSLRRERASHLTRAHDGMVDSGSTDVHHTVMCFEHTSGSAISISI